MKDKTAETLIGSKIAYYRAIRGMTQEELANKSGISKTYVSHIETGLKRPTFKVTVKIAKALKIDWKELTVSPLIKKIEELSIPESEKQKLLSSANRITELLES